MSIFQTNIPRADLERQHAQLQADLERLKKEKEQLDHAIVELTHRTKEFRANRARIDAQNQKLKEELARIQRYAEQQVIARNNTKKKAESVRNNKKALSDTLDTETVKQIRRKEAMEEAVQKVKQIFEEHNDRAGQLENARVRIEGELKQLRTLIEAELTKRSLLEANFARDIEVLKTILAVEQKQRQISVPASAQSST